MSSSLEKIFTILNTVLPDRVTYGTNIVDAATVDVYPFIVYQEISNRSIVVADDRTLVRVITYQITLVTEDKTPILEDTLEEALRAQGYVYEMTTEYVNEDNSVNRIYEIRQEEIIHE